MPFTPQQKHDRYFKLRRELETLVGDRCVLCGDADPSWHFDHPNGRSYDVEKIDSYKRLKMYIDDYLTGNGRRLCAVCNGSDGYSRRYTGDE